ncbi:MAG: DUF2791 family P-loop domain-containing protein [Eubacteriales bacterium]|nr:DUF2791 family P-loop domain-containing protein [Eubacteriales bacterium]
MFDMEARHIIEALRSGIPSRAVGRCFSEARPQIMKELSERLNQTSDGKSSGLIISGKYGEGKTHLLNTVFNMAHSQNMVVSCLSLSKETPLDKLHLVYQKIAGNTYLPMRRQPGFSQELEKITANSPLGSEMLMYSAKQLETDKLYFLLRSYFSTEEADEKFQLMGDLEGDFIAVGALKKIYRRIFNQPAKLSAPFSKTKNCGDYFAFLSHLFTQMGYNGWVILFDETELIGRLGKKSRLNAYRNMAYFLTPPKELESTFTLFALSASYDEDVIEGKHEYDNLAQYFPDHQEPMKSVLSALSRAPQLLPLTHDEIAEILTRIRDFHGKAYDWQPQVSTEELMAASINGGFLLRTRIRAVIEYLDQLYQYGDAGTTQINAPDRESFEETVSLEGIV